MQLETGFEIPDVSMAANSNPSTKSSIHLSVLRSSKSNWKGLQEAIGASPLLSLGDTDQETRSRTGGSRNDAEIFFGSARVRYD